MATFVSTPTSRPARRGTFYLVIGLLLLVTVTAAGWSTLQQIFSPHDDARFADYGVVPNLRLTERSGRAMSLGELKGSVWVASFIFTRCAGSCPAMSSKMEELQKALADVGDVRLVSFTVDPDNDTPQRLAGYADSYHADARTWLFLTGTRAQMQNLAKNDFHLGVQEGSDPREPIIHSKRFVLIDQTGHIRGYYNSDEPEAERRLIDDVATLVQEGA